MQFVTILFYIFSFFTAVAALAVISSRNPVHGVLWLIFAFFNSAGLFILLGAEMLAMLLVIVYVGAVAVLFLFVVMMLNIKTATLKKGFQAYLPLGLLLAGVLFAEIVMVINASTNKIELAKTEAASGEKIPEKNIPIVAKPVETTVEGEAEKPAEKPAKNVLTEHEITNAEAIGNVLYTKYILYFQLSGLILLVAMIGAITLTLRHREGVRKQSISVQVSRTGKTIDIVKVETGKGIN